MSGAAGAADGGALGGAFGGAGAAAEDGKHAAQDCTAAQAAQFPIVSPPHPVGGGAKHLEAVVHWPARIEGHTAEMTGSDA